MQVTLEEVSTVLKRVNIEIPADQVDVEIEKYFAGIQKTAKLQGFRPGKAPMQLVKRTYSDSMGDEVKRRFYKQTLTRVLAEQGIESIDTPTIESENLMQGVSFRFSALVDVLPEIQLKKYIGLEADKEKYAVAPEHIEDELGRMQKNLGRLVPLDSAATVENGAVVTIDYRFTVEGFPEESSSAKDAEVEVGAKRHISGFEEQLLGMKCGESREIRVTLPEGYRYSKVDGKVGVFLVTLKSICRKVLPELDDAFAQQCGEYESLQQLRDTLVKKHEKQETARIEIELKDRIIQALIEKNPLDAPESMVRRQLDHMLDIFKKSQPSANDSLCFDDNGFRNHFRDAAAERVKGRLLLTALMEKENIAADESDLEQLYVRFASESSESIDSIRAFYEANATARNTLVAEIKEEKAIRFLLDHAVITEVDKSGLKPG